MNLKIFIVTIVVVLFMPASGQEAWIFQNGKFYNIASAIYPPGLTKSAVDNDQQRFNRQGPDFQYPFYKSGQGIKQVLDSITWEGEYDSTGQMLFSEKVEHTYDNSGNVIEFSYYRWDESTYQWVFPSKEGYTYDAYGNTTQNLNYSRDNNTGQWFVDHKEEFTYDAHGNTIQYASYSWEESIRQLKPFEKKEWIYDSTGNIAHYLHYWWKGNPGQWVISWGRKYAYNVSENKTTIILSICQEDTTLWQPSKRYVNCYDSSGCMIQYSGYNYYTDGWKGNRRFEWEYDSPGNLARRIDMRWVEGTNNWTITDKKEFSYDVLRNLIKCMCFEWNEDTGQWDIAEQDEYSYDINGNLIHRSVFLWWDEKSKQWDHAWKEEYAYDDQGNLTVSQYHSWEKTTNQWVVYSRTEFGYDTDYRFEEVAFPFIFSRLYSHYGESIIPRLATIFDCLAEALSPGDTLDIIKKYQKDLLVITKLTNRVIYRESNEGDDLIPNERCMFYYSNLDNTVVHDLGTISVEVFPIPVSDFLNIRSKTNYHKNIFELYNLQGQKIVFKEIGNNDRINLRDITNGMYIYSICIEGVRLNGKLIKTK